MLQVPAVHELTLQVVQLATDVDAGNLLAHVVQPPKTPPVYVTVPAQPEAQVQEPAVPV